MTFSSNLRAVGVRQNSRPELVVFNVDESAISGSTNAGLLEGANYGIITKNGTGDYTITLNKTARRTLAVVGVSPVTVDLTHSITVTTSTVRVIFANLSGTDTNTDFHISILGFYSDIQR